MQNKTSKRLFGTKTNSKNYNPLALPNNYATFAHEFHHIFSISTSPPFHKIGGISFTPKHSPEKNFRKFFYINLSPKVTSLRISGAKNYDSFQVTFFYIFGAKNYVFLGRTFSYFYGAKNYGDEILFVAPQIGGCPSFIPALCPLSLLPLWSPLYLSSIQKATNLNIFLVWLCVLSGKSETQKVENQTNIYFCCGFRLCDCLFVLLLSLLSYWYGWLWCVIRPPSGQKQTKTGYFKKNPYYVMCFVGFLRYHKRQI